MTFRCSAQARERGDELAGTASTFRSFLLVENAGPWGVDALLDSRLPDGVGRRLGQACASLGIRPLLVRSGERTPAGGPRVYAAHCDPAGPWLAGTRLDSYLDLADLDLAALAAGRRPDWEPVDGPLFAVCTHGRHDACCAERGRPVAAALRRTGEAGCWEVSHIGGDRFAGNALVLPHGLYYGGLDEANVHDVVAATRRGEVHLDLLRGRSSYPMPVQYAEVALRRHLGELRVDALRLAGRRREGARTTATFAHGDGAWRVCVRTEHAEPARLTCSALRDNPRPVHVVEEIVPVDRP